MTREGFGGVAEAIEDRPSPLANENEEKAAQQRAAEIRIERRAKELTRTTAEKAWGQAAGVVLGVLMLIVAVGAIGITAILAWAAVKWAAGLL